MTTNTMGQNLPPRTIYEFIVNDFEDSWNSLAWNPTARGCSNFMFGGQATKLLEFAARLSATDSTGTALTEFSQALFTIEPKYSTHLPGICADFDEFDLPYKNSKGDELLWAIFDLVRNGQAHQYQQILVDLTDGVDWQISLTGAELGQHLRHVSVSPRPQEHLGYQRNSQRDLWLIVCPDVLFLDINVTAHFVILPNGTITQNHPETSYLYSSNGLNRGSVAVEFVGNFPSTRGRYYKPNQFGRDHLTQTKSMPAYI